jgi:hypothetical protein
MQMLIDDKSPMHSLRQTSLENGVGLFTPIEFAIVNTRRLMGTGCDHLVT